MTKLRNCPDCAAVEAFRKRLEKSGRKWIQSKDPCSTCNGSGKVKETPSKPGKRRKDMSGEEWSEADRESEWQEYINERPIQ